MTEQKQDTETIDRLFLELSQFTRATSAKELELQEQLAALRSERDALREALRLAERLCNEALPKFNWATSILDANAIDLLNRVPAALKAALAASEGVAP